MQQIPIYYCLKCCHQAPISNVFFQQNSNYTGSRDQIKKYTKHTSILNLSHHTSIFTDPNRYCEYVNLTKASGSIEIDQDGHKNLLYDTQSPIGKILDISGSAILNSTIKLVQGGKEKRQHAYPTGSINNNICSICGEYIAQNPATTSGIFVSSVPLIAITVISPYI
ncbi:hypothetical protein GCM10028808_61760 [Spirosoma migulaei]